MPLAHVSSAETLLWTARLTALSVAIQALELLQIRAAFREDGSFPWSVLRRDFANSPRWLCQGLDALLAYRPFVAVLVVQLGAALALPWVSSAACALLLLLTVLLVCVRFRGNYNGGSDSMTVVVLIGLTASQLAAQLHASDAWVDAGLGYIAAQLTLSYFVAGLAKLRTRTWQRGRALSQLVQVRQYVVPRALVALLSKPWASRLTGWLAIVFECSFPAALLLGRGVAFGLLAIAASFHVAIALAFGLNRFLWAWLSAYPALWYWSQRT